MGLVIVDKDKENLKCSTSFVIFANLGRKLKVKGAGCRVQGAGCRVIVLQTPNSEI